MNETNNKKQPKFGKAWVYALIAIAVLFVMWGVETGLSQGVPIIGG